MGVTPSSGPAPLSFFLTQSSTSLHKLHLAGIRIHWTIHWTRSLKCSVRSSYSPGSLPPCVWKTLEISSWSQGTCGEGTALKDMHRLLWWPLSQELLETSLQASAQCSSVRSLSTWALQWSPAWAAPQALYELLAADQVVWVLNYCGMEWKADWINRKEGR